MPGDPKTHPIRRVRDAFATLPDRSRLAEAKNFSRWVGCSESLIRNVENREVGTSDKLAKLIEDKTGVSAEWILSEPKPDDPILDRNGGPWTADRLDPFAFLPNLERLLAACPTRIFGIVGKMVESQMLAELHDRGEIRTLKTMLSFLQKQGFFEEPSNGRHPLEWLADKDEPDSLEKIGLSLLLSNSPTLSANQIRDLENLRVNEPEIQEGSRASEIYPVLDGRTRQRKAT